MGILFLARDPGPANQLVAAHELISRGPNADAAPGARHFFELAQNDLPARIYAYGPALDVWQRAKLPVTVLSFPQSVADLRALLAREHITRVVTGAGDVDDDTERLLWLAARSSKIPSHAFIDHPANLPQRFCLQDLSRAFPDFVHVPGDAYVPMLIEAGVPASRITVTGALHASRLKRLMNADPLAKSIRSAWGADSDIAVILFASECASEMAAYGRPAPYSEFEVLESLTRLVIAGGPVGSLSIPPDKALIAVRPHPRDRVGKYDRWLSASDGRPRRLVSAHGSPEQAILASDIVVGMDSSLLRDALALDKPAISLTGADLRL